ncbi:MAG: preprotein translocase subunit SecG [Lentisphaeraceae bacterium]|nr:preprotein translocase subunit SecG [Lentisphaeraceae bacterium]
MDGFLTTVIVISAILIVFAVIMQPSKDGGLGGLASGGVTDSVFGTNRNEFLAKTTWWLMAIFLISSIVLAKHKTRAHNEKEAEINTRSKAEEVSDSKVEDALNKAAATKEETKADAEKKVDDIKKAVEEKAAEAQKEAAEAKTETETKVDEVKKDAESALDKLKKDLPEAGK